jgi:hypothetical protein
VYQGIAICPDVQVESSSLANTMSAHPLEEEQDVGQHCLGRSGSQSIRGVGSDCDGGWAFVHASYS